MVPDKFRKKYRIPEGSARLRQQIALEAARRLIQGRATKDDDDSGDPLEWLNSVNSSDHYVAKRRAAAVLGHRVRQGDLPSDAEVREQVISLIRSPSSGQEGCIPIEEPEDIDEPPPVMSEQLDRFTVYKLRLRPLEAIKQNPRSHPEGDALYHSLQVFELARRERPYDEEFLLAALLHDVGKAIATDNPVGAAVESLRGSVTPRTLWLIEHHKDLPGARKSMREMSPDREHEVSDRLDDLALLANLDDSGRVPGQPVGTIEEALEYIHGLEREDYLGG